MQEEIIIDSSSGESSSDADSDDMIVGEIEPTVLSSDSSSEEEEEDEDSDIEVIFDVDGVGDQDAVTKASRKSQAGGSTNASLLPRRNALGRKQAGKKSHATPLKARLKVEPDDEEILMKALRDSEIQTKEHYNERESRLDTCLEQKTLRLQLEGILIERRNIVLDSKQEFRIRLEISLRPFLKGKTSDVLMFIPNQTKLPTLPPATLIYITPVEPARWDYDLSKPSSSSPSSASLKITTFLPTSSDKSSEIDKLVASYPIVSEGRFVSLGGGLVDVGADKRQKVQFSWTIDSTPMPGSLLKANQVEVKAFMESLLERKEREIRLEHAKRMEKMFLQEARPQPTALPGAFAADMLFDLPPYPAHSSSPLDSSLPSSSSPSTTTRSPIPFFNPLPPSTPPTHAPTVWEGTLRPFNAEARYEHISMVPRAVLDDCQELSSYPALDCWENSAESRSIVETFEQKMAEISVPGEDEPEKISDSNPFIDHLAFAGLSPSVIRRNFETLKEVIGATGITASQYKDAINQEEHDLGALVTLEEMAGQVISAITKSHGQLSSETLYKIEDKSRSEVDRFLNNETLCSFCGIPECDLHVDYISYNRPTNPRKMRVPHCDDCYKFGKDQDHLSEPSWTATTKEAVLKLLDDHPTGSSCTLARLSAQSCQEVHAFRELRNRPMVPKSPPPKSTSKHKSKKSIPAGKYQKEYRPYAPCKHLGDCVPCRGCANAPAGSDCPQVASHCNCSSSKLYCDNYCNCPPECSKRWRGCDCFDECDGKCGCRDTNRECSPTLCHKKNRFEGAITCKTCTNAPITYDDRRRTVVGLSSLQGLGLFMAEDAEAGDFLGVYGGELVQDDLSTNPASVSKVIFGKATGYVNYEFDHSMGYMVDSMHSGSTVRYINSWREVISPDGKSSSKSRFNCTTRVVLVEGMYNIAVYTTRALASGTELILDYGKHYPWRDDHEG